MADTDTEDDVEVKPQQVADASAPPAASAPPPGPSAFSESQTPWKNPMESAVSSMPPIDYAQAVTNRQNVLKNEIADVGRITATNRANDQRLGAAAEAKNQQIQAVDPNQLSTWNAQAKQEQYSTKPMEAFGSFAMVAALGMSAFTRSPMTASLNAMAGVMNGIKEGNDQAYERDYAAWKANNDVTMKRFGILKDQLSSDMDLWKQKGASGATDLSNTLLKYGLYKDQALVDAGLVEPVETAMQARFKAVEGMRKASEEIETQHSIRQAIMTEEAHRKELGMPPTSPQDRAEIKAAIEKPGTPEEISFRQAWKKFNDENPKATADELIEKRQELRTYGRTIASQANTEALDAFKKSVPDATPSETAMISTALNTKGAKAPQIVAGMTAAMDEIKAKADAGTPLSAEERSTRLRAAASPSKMTDPGLDVAAEAYIKSGVLPSRNAELNAKILDRAAVMAKDRGINITDLPKMQQEFKAQQVAIGRYFSGPIGQQIVAMNTAMNHLETARELGQALKNGDLKSFNTIRQYIADQTGSPVPNNLNMASQVLGGEVMKAIGVAGAGTGPERSELAHRFTVSASPAQLEGAIHTAEKLLAGQLESKRNAFVVDTGLPVEKFDQRLSESTMKQVLSLIHKDDGGATPPASMLKEGEVTTFKGDKGSWTLINGKPTKVK